jgi:AcrR family transcriptional regulator
MNKGKEITVVAEKKIIESAHEIFVEKGLEGARMQEIADRAGINKALLHYYFRSKDQLFDAVFQRILQQMLPDITTVISSGKTVEGVVEKLVAFYNDLFRRNPYLPQFFFHEIWQNPDRLAAFIKLHEVKPKELIDKLNYKLVGNHKTEYMSQHIIANILGMCLFPHIARPLFQRMFFDEKDQDYDQFLDERTVLLSKMSSFMGASVMNDAKSEEGEN